MAAADVPKWGFGQEPMQMQDLPQVWRLCVQEATYPTARVGTGPYTVACCSQLEPTDHAPSHSLQQPPARHTLRHLPKCLRHSCPYS
ncbi:hypothetical protein LB505_003929 [Fusarium chuoi]|nr:hypothetical protein LB505_003929 [Fusarium chuoi]